MQVVLISGETGCGKTTQVINSLLCLLYGTSNMACTKCVSEIAFLVFLLLSAHRQLQCVVNMICDQVSFGYVLLLVFCMSESHFILIV